MGLALPSVPNWTSIPPCQQHSEESEAVRTSSTNSVSLKRESWQVTVHRTKLAGLHCVSLVAQKVTASRNCRNSMWELLVLQSVPLGLEMTPSCTFGRSKCNY